MNRNRKFWKENLKAKAKLKSMKSQEKNFQKKKSLLAFTIFFFLFFIFNLYFFFFFFSFTRTKNFLVKKGQPSLRNMAILSKACKPDHFKSQNSPKLSFTNIVRSQTLLTFLLCVTQTWMTQLVLATVLGRILVICMVSQFMWKRDFLLHGTYL